MKISFHLDPDQWGLDGLASVFIRIPQLKRHWELAMNFRKIYDQCGMPNPLVLDLLFLAGACYTVDKQVSRNHAVDNWTREFEIELPVSDPDCWYDVADDLDAMLGFLTGDIWHFTFRPSNMDLFEPGKNWRRRKPFQATAVHLFSGGLDSLAGAIDNLAQSTRSRLLLLGHYDAPGPRHTQQSLYDNLPLRYRRRAKLLPIRVSHSPQKAYEPTMRSRSLLFLSLGVYAAHAMGAEMPVYASENGFMAINLPLSQSRVGSCSTRTMHPFFLNQLSSILKQLGIQNEIVNPYQLKTKGECIAECADFDLLRSLVNVSVSCAHYGRRQHWIRKSAANCGYCYPCLIRRAALHVAGLDQGNEYGVDICTGEMFPDNDLDSSDDLRAILGFVRHKWKASELVYEIAKVAPVDQLDNYAALVARGIKEIRYWFDDKGTKQLRRGMPRISNFQ